MGDGDGGPVRIVGLFGGTRVAEELPRVRFSTNDRTAINRYGLWLKDSVSDLQELGEKLTDGLRVIIYETGELEMEAVLHFDPEWNSWVATGDETTIVYHPGAFGEDVSQSNSD